MKPHEKPLDFKISMFQFMITPTQISFQRTPAQAYFMELCRGPQVYKRFTQEIWVHAQEKTYLMTNGQTADIKVHNDKGTVLEWALYKVTDDEMKQYITCVPIDLSNVYLKYLTALKAQAKQYSRLLFNEGHSIQLEKEWPLLKNKLPFEQVVTAINKELGIEIIFKVSIRCELDRLAEAEGKSRLERQLSKTSSKGSYNLGSKSYLQDHNSQKLIEIKVNSDNKESADIASAKVNKENIPPKNETLSDIVEASNENSSTKNHQEKNHRLQSVISQIPEEEQTSPTFPPSTKTQNFDRINLGEFDSRRINTLREDYSHEDQPQDQFAQAYQSMMKSKIKELPTESEIKEDPFAAIETAIPSEIDQPLRPQRKTQHVEKRRNVLPMIAVIVLIVLGIASFSSLGFSHPILSREYLSRYLPFASIEVSQSKGKQKNIKKPAVSGKIKAIERKQEQKQIQNTNKKRNKAKEQERVVAAKQGHAKRPKEEFRR